MTTYALDFTPSALKSWRKLGSAVRNQFADKLEERCRQPRALASKLSQMPNCYKIKQRRSGYRLVYEVDDATLILLVISVYRRSKAYDKAAHFVAAR